MTSVSVSTLANGLRVATDTMTGVETVSVGVWIEAGSRFETPAISGASHFLEHMVFKGTRRRDARAIAEEIESVGGHLNAHTSREYTAFYAKVLKDDVALAVDVIADFLQNATLEDSELNRERTVVIQEIMQSLDTPDDVIFDRFQETAFPDQPLGRPVLGAPEKIEQLSRETLLSYMREHYGAPRMIVAAAGNIAHSHLLDLATRAFADLPTSTAARRDTARYRGGDWRLERDLEQVHIVLGFEGVGYRDPDFYPLSVLTTLLGGGMSSRLFQEAREKRGLVYNIYAFPSSYTDTGLFGIYAGTGEDEVAQLLPVITDQLAAVCEGVPEAEVARARAQIRAGVLMSLESTSARCEQLARQMMIFGRPIPVDETMQRIEAVDSEAVTRVARRLIASPPTFAVLGPIGQAPSIDAIAARLA
jgi:predicted Zn-dependent peptidase